MGTDTPGITSPTLLCFAESRYRNGVSLAVYPKAATEAHTRKFLVFEDMQTAVMWAALRTKELSSEGVEVCAFPTNEALKDLLDERVKNPITRHRMSLVARILEW